MDMQVNGGVAVAAFANHAIVRADLLSGSYAPPPPSHTHTVATAADPTVPPPAPHTQIHRGNKPKKMFNKQDGVDCVQCTHHNSAVIYAATLGASRGQIIYHSMYDNVILRRFKDHRASYVDPPKRLRPPTKLLTPPGEHMLRLLQCGFAAHVSSQ